MAGEWSFRDFSGDADLITPEAHWLRTVMMTDGWIAVSLRLNGTVVVELAEAWADAFQTAEAALLDDLPRAKPDTNGFGFWLEDASLSALRRRAEKDPSEAPPALWIEMLVAPEGRAELDRFARDTGSEIVSASPIGPAAEVTARRPEPPRPVPDDAVVIGIVDDGIAIANERFRDARGRSRILWFLDMTDPTPNPTGELAPEDEPFADSHSRYWSGTQLDRLLARYGDDEAEMYRVMGLVQPGVLRREPLAQLRTHGTHVLDAAAGYSPHEDHEAARRPIIAVQLPSRVIEDRSGTLMPMNLARALTWIRVRAGELLTEGDVGPRPMVLNFSFGMFAGPHDGLDPVERRIKGFLDDYESQLGGPACEAVLAAGNGFQERAVARLAAPAHGAEAEMPWRIQPGDRTPSYLQIWLPPSAPAVQQIEVRLLPPHGGPATVLPSELGKVLDWQIDGVTFARIYHQSVLDPNRFPRERVTIALRPTEEFASGDPVVPAGLWQVAIRNKALAQGTPIDLRIQRDDPVSFTARLGRQSYFDHPDYPRFEEVSGRLINDEERDVPPVIRQRTLSVYATGSRPLVAAGYRRSEGDPAIYSASGPTSTTRTGPNVAAPSDESPSHFGQIAAGTFSGSAMRLNGTSVAAPQITRALAAEIAGGGTSADFLARIGQVDDGTLKGPHGGYEPKLDKRAGCGRFVQPLAPPHRRRIED